MASILRWFQHDGQRCRAYFRTDPHSGRTQLVIRGPRGERVMDGVQGRRLEDFAEDELRSLATAGRL
jgi:hypothetical protein